MTKPIMSVEQARHDIEAIRDQLGKPVDPKIREFLIGLRRWGVETVMSCQGHWLNGYKFPWVSIKAESLPLAAELLMLNYRRQPTRHRPLFIIEPAADPRIRTLKEGLRLPLLQREIARFGKFLQELPDNYFSEQGEE